MKPTVGRIVIYHVGENDPSELRNNHAKDLPAIVVASWRDDCANLKIFTDGPTDAWKTSVAEGEGPYCWSWPKREG